MEVQERLLEGDDVRTGTTVNQINGDRDVADSGNNIKTWEIMHLRNLKYFDMDRVQVLSILEG